MLPLLTVIGCPVQVPYKNLFAEKSLSSIPTSVHAPPELLTHVRDVMLVVAPPLAAFHVVTVPPVV